MGLGFRIGIWDWDLGLVFKIWDLGLVLKIWDLGLVLKIWDLGFPGLVLGFGINFENLGSGIGIWDSFAKNPGFGIPGSQIADPCQYH